MGFVQYIGSAPRTESVVVSGLTQLVEAIHGQTLQLPDAICAQLVADEAALWLSVPSFPAPEMSVAAPYMATSANRTLFVDAPTTIYLADATRNADVPIAIKNASSGVVTVQPIAGQTIDGSALAVLAPAQSLSIESDGGVTWRALLPATIETRDVGEVTPEQYGARGDGMILYDAAMTAGSPTLASSDHFVNFTEADIGKTIIVSGVGAGNDALVTTITSVQSPSQVTLASPAVNSTPDPAGAQFAVYGTDDTAAIQAASDAAAASGSGAGGTVRFDRKVYMVCGPLIQGGPRLGNAQITLPYGNGIGGHLGRLTWQGVGDPTGQDALGMYATPGCTTIVSTLLDATYSATYGVPSVIGGPTREQSSGFNQWAFTMDGLMVVTPRNPSLGAVNLERCNAASIGRLACGTLEWGYPLSGWDTLAINQPSHPQAAALIMPMTGNMQAGSGIVEGFLTWGYFVGIVPSEHVVVLEMAAQPTQAPVAVRAGGFCHHARFVKLDVQGCPYAISGWDPTQPTVAAAIVPVPAAPGPGRNGLLVDSLDLEDYGAGSTANAWALLVSHINDPNNNLVGYVRFSRWSYVGASDVFTEETSLVVNGGFFIPAFCNSSASGRIAAGLFAGDVGFGTAYSGLAATGLVGESTYGLLLGENGSTYLNAQNTVYFQIENSTVGLYDNAGFFLLTGLTVHRITVADTNYTVQPSDHIIEYATLTAARTVTLPVAGAANVGSGKQFIVKDGTGNAATENITIIPQSGQTIDGAASKVINTAYGVVRVYCTGSEWLTY